MLDAVHAELGKAIDALVWKTQHDDDQAALERKVKEGGAVEKTTGRVEEIAQELARKCVC